MERIESTTKFDTNGIPMWRISITYVTGLNYTDICNSLSASFPLPEDGHLKIGNSNHRRSHVEAVGYTPNGITKAIQHLDEQIRPGSVVWCHIFGQVVEIPPKRTLTIEIIENKLQIWRL